MAEGAVSDICLVLEGTYPYVPGGVSTWTHDLINAHPDLSFEIVTLLPKREERKLRFDVPRNVKGVHHIYIQEIDPGPKRTPGLLELMADLRAPLEALQSPKGGLDDVAAVLKALAPKRDRLGRHALLNSPESWELLVEMYEANHPDSSFLDYFWSWRALVSGLYSVLLGEVPPARVYHTVSTGYAGLFAARARLETGRPSLVTEHGIYTNERRIEIAMADWLFEAPADGMNVNIWHRNLKDMWVDTFASYSRACYAACARILTLYEGNQQFQLDDGAPAEKLAIIPNGIDVRRYAPLRPAEAVPGEGGRRPHVALIGRVVPIKDIKTFVRAMGFLREVVPEVAVSIIGPFEEDMEYYEECRAMVVQMGLERTIAFAGRKKLDEVIPTIDVQVLTSISEGMPLVILEAGAAGIPAVATDVGACREMIMGRTDEEPRLGAAGAVTGLSSPKATADACRALLVDKEWYRRCSEAMRARVRRYYDKRDQDRTYRAIYDECMATATDMSGAWPAGALAAQAAE